MPEISPEQASVSLCNQIVFNQTLIINEGNLLANGLAGQLSGVDIELNGDLTVDQDFTFDNCRIKFRPNKRISVEGSKIKFLNCKLFSCDTMWEGIFLHQANLTMTQCQVEDAKSAINVVDGYADLSVESNSFRLNYVCINLYERSILPYSGFVNFANFRNNVMNGAGQFKQPYSNNTIRGQAAIKVNKCLALMDKAVLPANIIENYIDGISVKDAYLKTANVRYESCRRGIKADDSYVIQQGFGDSPNSLKSFEEVRSGILAVNSGIKASKNYFIDGTLSNIEIAGNMNFNNEFTSNYFEDTRGPMPFAGAILIYASNNSLKNSIKDNKINSISSQYGLVISGTAGALGGLQITDNELAMVNCGEGMETRGTSYTTLTFGHNIANVLGPTSWGPFHFHNFAPTGNKVYDNFVNCSDMNFVNKAAYFTQDMTADFCRNTCNNTNFGLHFTGSAYESNINTFTFGIHQRGALIGYVTPQIIKGNSWLDISNYADWAVTLDINNNFKVDPTIQGHFPEFSIFPPEVFKTDGTGYEDCAFIVPPGISDSILYLKLLLHQMDTISTLEDVYKEDIYRLIYRNLLAHPLLRQDNVLDNYFLSKSTTFIGQIEVVKRQFNMGFIAQDTIVAIERLIDTIQHKIVEFSILDSIIQSTILVTPAQMAAKTALQTNLLVVLSELKTLNDAANIRLKHNWEVVYANCLNATPSNQMNENEKITMLLSLKKSIDHTYEFSTSEMAQLFDIADQCEQIGGWAVHDARGLLPLCYKANYIDRTFDDCVGNPRSSTTSESRVMVFPNPASDHVSIRLGSVGENVSLEIYNANGNLIKSLAGTSPLYDLDLATFESGLYILRVSSKSRIDTQKFVVIR